MEDTPEHIKKLQLEIWLTKPPGERLRRILEDNDALFNLWSVLKKSNAERYPVLPETVPTKTNDL